MRPTLDLDRYAHLADLFRYSVSFGAPRFHIHVPVRRPRNRWWQFWRPSPHQHTVVTLIDGPLSERLLTSWIKRLTRPSTTRIKSWERDAPDLVFRSPAVREALLRELTECYEGTKRIREAQENPDPNTITFFASGRAIGRKRVAIDQALVNGQPTTLEGTILELQ